MYYSETPERGELEKRDKLNRLEDTCLCSCMSEETAGASNCMYSNSNIIEVEGLKWTMSGCFYEQSRAAFKLQNHPLLRVNSCCHFQTVQQCH